MALKEVHGRLFKAWQQHLQCRPTLARACGDGRFVPRRSSIAIVVRIMLWSRVSCIAISRKRGDNIKLGGPGEYTSCKCSCTHSGYILFVFRIFMPWFSSMRDSHRKHLAHNENFTATCILVLCLQHSRLLRTLCNTYLFYTLPIASLATYTVIPHFLGSTYVNYTMECI